MGREEEIKKCYLLNKEINYLKQELELNCRLYLVRSEYFVEKIYTMYDASCNGRKLKKKYTTVKKDMHTLT